MTAKQQGDFLNEFIGLSEAERASVCWAAAWLTLTNRSRPPLARLRHAAILARLALRAGHRDQLPRFAAWALLIGAGLCVATGQDWAAPLAVLLCVSSMAARNLGAWCELARQLGSGWRR